MLGAHVMPKEFKKMIRILSAWGAEVQNTFLIWHLLFLSPLLVLILWLPVSGGWAVRIPKITPTFQHYLLVKYCHSLDPQLTLAIQKTLLALLNVPFNASNSIWQCEHCSCLWKSFSTPIYLRGLLHACSTVMIAHSPTYGGKGVAMIKSKQGKQVNCWQHLL